MLLEGVANTTAVIDSSAVLSYGCRRVVASAGFEEVGKKQADDILYSIVLETFPSFRYQPFDFKKSIRARVQTFYEYLCNVVFDT